MSNNYNGNDEATRAFSQPPANDVYRDSDYVAEFDDDFSDDISIDKRRQSLLNKTVDLERHLPRPLLDGTKEFYLERAADSLNPEHLQALRNAVFTKESEDDFLRKNRNLRDSINSFAVSVKKDLQGAEDERTEISNRLAETEEGWANTTEELKESEKKFTISAVVAGMLGLALIGSLVWGFTRDTVPEDPTEAQQAIIQMQEENDRLEEEVRVKDREVQQANQRASDAVRDANDPESARAIDKLSRDVESRDRTIEQLRGENERANQENDRIQNRVDSLERELRESQRSANNSAPVTVTETVQAPVPAAPGGGSGESTLDRVNPFN